MRKIFSIILLCVCIGACMAKPDSDVVVKPSERITVGVLDFTLNSDDKSLEPYRRGLTDMFITELQKVPELQVVERTRLDTVMGELGVDGHDNINPTEAGRLMGAQTLFYGSLTAVFNMMRLDGRLVHVETGQILAAGGAISERFEIDAEKISQMVRKVSKRIAGSLVADKFYSEGRTAEEESDRDGAIRHYRQALQYYPDHELSREALERLQAQ